MSQIYKALTSGGPIPPEIPTSFVTDSGTAVPVANILNILGDDSNVNNNNGILTTGSGNTVTAVLSNRINVTTTTSDGAGQTQTVTLITTTNATSSTFRVLITGIDIANTVSSGAELLGASRTFAGSAVVLGTNDVFLEEDAVLAATDYDVIASGADLVIQFTGIAGRTIVWRALFEYIQTP
jgi:hypothetical protein